MVGCGGVEVLRYEGGGACQLGEPVGGVKFGAMDTASAFYKQSSGVGRFLY